VVNIVVKCTAEQKKVISEWQGRSKQSALGEHSWWMESMNNVLIFAWYIPKTQLITVFLGVDLQLYGLNLPKYG